MRTVIGVPIIYKGEAARVIMVLPKSAELPAVRLVLRYGEGMGVVEPEQLQPQATVINDLSSPLAWKVSIDFIDTRNLPARTWLEVHVNGALWATDQVLAKFKTVI